MRNIINTIIFVYFWVSSGAILVCNYDNIPVGVFVAFINLFFVAVIICCIHRFDQIMDVRKRCMSGEITKQQAIDMVTPKKQVKEKQESTTVNKILEFKDEHPILVALLIERITEYCKKTYGLDLSRQELAGIIVAVNQIRNSDVLAIVEFAKNRPFLFIIVANHLAETYMSYRKRGTELTPQQIAAIIIAFNYFRD